jgi:EmrB/QacA subfamily drug resistance transporter
MSRFGRTRKSRADRRGKRTSRSRGRPQSNAPDSVSGVPRNSAWQTTGELRQLDGALPLPERHRCNNGGFAKLAGGYPESVSTSVQARRAGLGLVVVCSAHFLIGADGLAVATALPSLQRNMDVAPIDSQWVLSAYGLTFGSSLLLGGRLGDLYGHRRVLGYGMTLFAAGSLLAGFSPALSWLIVARALQGLGAAAGVPAALALIASLYPAGPGRARAMSLLAAMATVGTMSGLILGGIITDLLGWRWVFLLLAIPAILAVLAAPLVLDEARAAKTPSLDIAGAVLVGAGVMAALYGLTTLERDGFVRPVLSFAASAVLLAAFFLWERRTPAPLVRFDILRVRSLRAASCGIGVNALAATSVVYVGSLYLQNALGYSAMESALAIIPIDVLGFVVALIGAPLAQRAPRLVLLTCFALTTLSLLWLARAPVPAKYLIDVCPPLVVLGASLTVVFVVTTNQAVSEVGADEKGLASGIFETANHLVGGAVGVTIYAAIFSAFSAGVSDSAGYRAAFLAGAVLVACMAALSLSQTSRGERSGATTLMSPRDP